MNLLLKTFTRTTLAGALLSIAASAMAASDMSGMDMQGMDMGDMPGMTHKAPQKAVPPKPADTDKKTSPKAPVSDTQSMPGMPGMAPGPAPTNAAATVQAVPPPPMDMAGMDMNDNRVIHQVLVENLEYTNSDQQSGAAWDAQAWVGRDINKLWLKTEGGRLDGKTTGAKVEALWAHAVAPFWDTQLGARHDFGPGPARHWVAFGVQGLSPYWFDVEATAYVGDAGRTAARLKTEYELLFTQRLILTPELELNAYGKDDPERGIGAGLSDGKAELRLRYEFTRQFAPYVGFAWDRSFGKTATLARGKGEAVIDNQFVAGLRFWF
jgi:copper resistance protein B